MLEREMPIMRPASRSPMRRGLGDGEATFLAIGNCVPSFDVFRGRPRLRGIAAIEEVEVAVET